MRTRVQLLFVLVLLGAPLESADAGAMMLVDGGAKYLQGSDNTFLQNLNSEFQPNADDLTIEGRVGPGPGPAGAFFTSFVHKNTDHLIGGFVSAYAPAGPIFFGGNAALAFTDAAFADILTLKSNGTDPPPQSLDFDLKATGIFFRPADPDGIFEGGHFAFVADQVLLYDINGNSSYTALFYTENGVTVDDLSSTFERATFTYLKDNRADNSFEIDLSGRIALGGMANGLAFYPFEMVLGLTANALSGLGVDSFALMDASQTLSFTGIHLDDGTTPEANGFQLAFESGLTSPNAAAVPEPSTISVLTGLLGCFLLTRRRQQRRSF